MSSVISAFPESWGIAEMTVSNQRLFCETESKPITNIGLQRQLRLYRQVARYSEADPACRVVSERDHPEWRRPRGRLQSLWLRQVDDSCSELLGMESELAWRLTWGDLWGWG